MSVKSVGNNNTYQYILVQYSTSFGWDAYSDMVVIKDKEKVHQKFEIGTPGTGIGSSNPNYQRYSIKDNSILFYYLGGCNEELEKLIEKNNIPSYNSTATRDGYDYQEKYYYLKMTFNGTSYKLEKEENPPYTDIYGSGAKC